MRCPGLSLRNWKPEDVYDVACPACGYMVEFFKDQTLRVCPGCGYKMKNPKLDLGCAQWCAHGKECLAAIGNFNVQILYQNQAKRQGDRALADAGSSLKSHGGDAND